MYALIVSYWKQSTLHELLAVFVSRWKRFVPNIWNVETAVSNVLTPCGIEIINVAFGTSSRRWWSLKFWSVKVFCLYLFRIAEHLSVMKAMNILLLEENYSICLGLSNTSQNNLSTQLWTVIFVETLPLRSWSTYLC